MPSPIKLNPAALYGARATGLGRGPFNNRYIQRTQAQYGGGMAPAPDFVIPICAVARLGPLGVGFATFSYTPRPQRLNLPFPPLGACDALSLCVEPRITLFAALRDRDARRGVSAGHHAPIQPARERALRWQRRVRGTGEHRAICPDPIRHAVRGA